MVLTLQPWDASAPSMSPRLTSPPRAQTAYITLSSASGKRFLPSMQKPS